MSRFMKFKQGKDTAERSVLINMDQVCHVMTDGGTGSVLTFCAIIGNEPAYLCVNASPDEIANALVNSITQGD